MYTVIVFWQKEELNEQIEWFEDKNDEQIKILTINSDTLSDTNIELLREELYCYVKQREQWRIFLIDNHNYRCVSLDENDEKSLCCCCKKDCKRDICGMGRNPFVKSENIFSYREQSHRRDLLNLIHKLIYAQETKYIQPENAFVIAVRDKDFKCNHEINIPNFKEQYWNVGEEFPTFCRYLIYDVQYIDKNKYEREFFWFYCLVILLAKNELYMEQFLPRNVYRIVVEYSQVEFGKYLSYHLEEIDKQICVLEEKAIECENLINIRESTIGLHPLTLKNGRLNLEYKSTSNDKREIAQLKDSIKKIYYKVPKEYEKQWEEMRLLVGEEDGENAEICEEEKEQFESRLLDIDFSRQVKEVSIFEKDMSGKEVLDEFQKYVSEAENLKKNRPNIKTYIGCSVLSFFYPVLYFFMVSGKNMTGSVICFLTLAILLPILMHLIFWVQRKRNDKDILELLRYVDEYQKGLVDKREEILNGARNTMLYWKRKQNLGMYKAQIATMREEIGLENNKCKKIKQKLVTFLNMEEEIVDVINREKREEEILIGSKTIKTDFFFIKRVRFCKTEK